MKQFEYKFASPEATVSELNELGAEGWEAITCDNKCIFLKREIIKEVQRERARKMSEFLDKPILDFHHEGWISVRVMNVLSHAGIKTPRQLIQTERSVLLGYRNFGKKSLTEMEEFLDHYGFHFGQNISEYGTESN